MKKPLLLTEIIVIVFLLLACIQIPSEVKSIEIIDWPAETEFVYGGSDIDVSEVKVRVTYMDNSTELLSVNEVTMQGDITDDYKLSMRDTGDFHIKFSYGGVSLTVYYSIEFDGYIGLEDESYQFYMIQVGESQAYTVPIGENNTNEEIMGGFLLGETEVTYDLWYHVREWAESQPEPSTYTFVNKGSEGSQYYPNMCCNMTPKITPIPGAEPSVGRGKQPVTQISWIDTILWLNALSEMEGLTPVYESVDQEVLRDASGLIYPYLDGYDINDYYVARDIFDHTVQTDNDGYRLPTKLEWEMAARWRNGDGDGSILAGERYWTPGDYASGATGNYLNISATWAVAACNLNMDKDENGNYLFSSYYSGTENVKERTPNHLGIYDMTGNVNEFLFDYDDETKLNQRPYRGGSHASGGSALQVYKVIVNKTYTTKGSVYGFRIAKALPTQ